MDRTIIGEYHFAAPADDPFRRRFDRHSIIDVPSEQAESSRQGVNAEPALNIASLHGSDAAG